MIQELPAMINARVLQKQCRAGDRSFCCKECLMGPCNFSINNSIGVCGAKRELVVSRNMLRMAAGGAAAHCGHAQELLDFFSASVSTEKILKLIPDYILRIWKNLGIEIPAKPGEQFREITDALHLTSMGVSGDYADVLKWSIRMGIVDGYFGLYLATNTEDKYYGKPKVKSGHLNLSCINPDKINIAVHGHEPMLAEAIVKQAKNFPDVNLIGVCCTGASLLARHNIPHAAHFLLQEDVVATGLIEAMVVDSQCIMPSLSDLCECFHTKLITTSHIGKMQNALHLPFNNEEEADAAAFKIIETAIDNKANRKTDFEEHFKVNKPEEKHVILGFSDETVPVEKMAEDIAQNKVKGVIAVVGCANPRSDLKGWVEAFKILSKDYYILTTGCMAFEFGSKGLLDGERFFHLGSCVNNSRVAEVFRKISVKLNRQINELPFIVSAPAPITEKAVAIGMFFTSIGCSLHIGEPARFASDPIVANTLISVLHDTFGTKLYVNTDPLEFQKQLLIEHSFVQL